MDEKPRTALIVQWVCFSLSIIVVLIAIGISPEKNRLSNILFLATFIFAIVWIFCTAAYRRKLNLSYGFPTGVFAATVFGLLFAPFYICAGCAALLPGAAEFQIAVFREALDAYKQDVGDYPTTAQGLQALRTKLNGVAGWDGPYLLKDIPNDPWNHPYIYKFPGKSPRKPEIISYGADGKPGGSGENADISSESTAQ